MATVIQAIIQRLTYIHTYIVNQKKIQQIQLVIYSIKRKVHKKVSNKFLTISLELSLELLKKQKKIIPSGILPNP